MKKLLGTFVICGALLAACSNDDKADSNKEQGVVVTEQAISEKLITNETSTEPKKEITQEEAKKVVNSLVDKAKEDALIEEIVVEEKEKEVNVQIKFPEDVSEQDRGSFLFNYMIFIEKQYPDQEIKYSVAE